MAKILEFYYDCASPNSYLANKVLAPILERTGAELVYRPCLLGGVFKATGNQAPWITFAPVKPKMAYGMLEMERFIKKNELNKYKMNPHFPLNTLLPMRAAIAAEIDGKLPEFVRAIGTLAWEEEVKIDDPEALVEGLSSKGLDGQTLIANTQEPEVKQKLIEATEEAVKRGIFGVPTFFIGDEMFFGKDTLHLVEEELNK